MSPFSESKQVVNESYFFSSNFGDNESTFSSNSFKLLLKDLNFECNDWINYWKARGGEKLAFNYWSNGIRPDWIWGLAFPLLTEIKNAFDKTNEKFLLGISALPGCGKSTLGKWLEAASSELNWPIKVVSLDDFYLPGRLLDKEMSDNPWGVPRGLPGSHSIELLNETIDIWKTTGNLKAPQFDKALRGGRGDRSGWITANPKVLIIEGWFLGCKSLNTSQKGDFSIEKLNPILSIQEVNYRERVQQLLEEYTSIWQQFERVWHIKPDKFSNTGEWKIGQENEMYKSRGSSLRGKALSSFLRMIQAAIPQESLMNIQCDALVKISQSRQVLWTGRKEDEPLERPETRSL